MRGGSVADRLSHWRGHPPLNAVQRIEVAAGAAHGLAALHAQASRLLAPLLRPTAAPATASQRPDPSRR